MRTIKFIYTIVRENGFVFSSNVFSIYDIELGMAETFLRKNGVLVQEINRRQYTGCKDSNGKEIFENDLIAHKNTIYTVIWSDVKSCFCVVTPNKWVDHKGGPTFYYKSMIWASKAVVVGNVYQNPELLK